MSFLNKIFSIITIALVISMTVCKQSITMRALILSTVGTDSEAITLNFKAYGIPYDLIEFSPTVSFNGNLELYNKSNEPKYNLIIINGGNLIYEKNGNWISALTSKQWSYLDEYEAKNSIRRIVISEDPSSNTEVQLYNSTNWGEVLENQPLLAEQSAEVKDIFNEARVKITAPLDVNNIYHTRVKIIKNETSQPFLYYSNKGSKGPVAAILTKYNDGREVMSFFFGLGSWSKSCLVINHLWLTWGTRSIFNGFRRIYFTPHIDDVFLATELVNINKGTTTGGDTYRITESDYIKIAEFQKNILNDMPLGSFYRVELAINGNGILINGDYDQSLEIDGNRYCDIEYVKPPGTGDKRWPKENFQLTPSMIATLKKDPIYNYFNHNTTAQQEFFWSSHTFTHENLDDAHESDVDNEIRLNIDMANRLGLLDTEYWSGGSIITPQISGLHNKDALEVFLKYGIQSATGDLSRSALCNKENPYLPFFTTENSSHLEGFPIIPRSPTEIYYFCSTREENTWMYNQLYESYFKSESTFDQIMERESERVLILMMKLRHEAHQFHQANLRYYDKNGKNGESLLEDWTRSVVNLYNKYVEWPLISLKIDKQAEVYLNRNKRENCGHETKLIIENNRITGISVSASEDECTVPVTVPFNIEKSSLPSGVTLEQVGKDPVTIWVPLRKGETKIIKIDQIFTWNVQTSSQNQDQEQTQDQIQTQTQEQIETQTQIQNQTQTEEPTEIQTEEPTEIQTEEPTETQTEEPTETQTQIQIQTQTASQTQIPSQTQDQDQDQNQDQIQNQTQNKFKCTSELFDYPCCPPIVTTVFYTDESGDWGFDFSKNDWCGLTPYTESTCWSIRLGYPCCKGCTVLETDLDGKWGIENNQWCGIPSSC